MGGASVGQVASPLAAEGAQQGTGGNPANGRGARATAAAGASAGGGEADAADTPSAPGAVRQARFPNFLGLSRNANTRHLHASHHPTPA